MTTLNDNSQPKQRPNGINNLYTYIAAGVVVIALAAWGIYAYNHKEDAVVVNNQQTNTQQTPTPSDTANIASTTDTTTSPSAVNIPAKLSYGAAIKAYPYRFQFSKCSGNPGSMAVKKGSIVMIDNRDAVAHTIKADGQIFKIAGYDYALLHTALISNTFITCDGGGAATLNVEK